jgi:hypothetical protein
VVGGQRPGEALGGIALGHLTGHLNPAVIGWVPHAIDLLGSVVHRTPSWHDRNKKFMV